MTLLRNIVRGLILLGSGIAAAQGVEWVFGIFKIELIPFLRLGIVIMLFLLVLLIQGFFVEGFLLRRTTFELRDIGVSIAVMNGDLFDQDGVIVIPVNDCFDTVVDDIHIARKSLHGFAIMKYWPGNVAELDVQIGAQLNHAQFEQIHRDGTGKTKRYPIGTAVCVIDRTGRKLIFVALTKTDSTTNLTEATVDDLVCAMRGALDAARIHASGMPVSFPLLGSGLARIKLPHQALLDVILAMLVSESNTRKVTDHFRVVLKGRLANSLNYSALKTLWEV